MRGVLVFGADNEAKARREAYNLLNEVIELHWLFFLVVLYYNTNENNKEIIIV